MPRITGAHGAVQWQNTSGWEWPLNDLATSTATPSSAAALPAAGNVSKGVPRPFSRFLLQLIRQREEAVAQGDAEQAEALRKVLSEGHGVVIDVESGAWKSRGGWRGEFGGDPEFEGPLPGYAAKKHKRRGRHKPKKSDKEPARNRHKLLANFLVEEFGRELLGEGCGVLDIAGGKGFVTSELQDVHGIACTLIETNPSQGPTRISGADNGGEVIWRELNLTVWEGAFEHLQEQSPIEGGAPLDGQAELARLCRGCSFLVGMHPDEATDAIVDTALALRKPFAVVPCCVFPRRFPGRRLPGGGPVTRYEDLLVYLKAKHPGIQQKRLNFNGRSEVLYWRPTSDEAFALSQPELGRGEAS